MFSLNKVFRNFGSRLEYMLTKWKWDEQIYLNIKGRLPLREEVGILQHRLRVERGCSKDSCGVTAKNNRRVHSLKPYFQHMIITKSIKFVFIFSELVLPVFISSLYIVQQLHWKKLCAYVTTITQKQNMNTFNHSAWRYCSYEAP